MDQTGSGKEMRKNLRLKVRLRSGILRQMDRKRLVDCVIYDLSKTGARVVLHESRHLPTLLLLEDEIDKTVHAARVVYVRPNGIGLEFVEDAPDDKQAFD